MPKHAVLKLALGTAAETERMPNGYDKPVFGCKSPAVRRLAACKDARDAHGLIGVIELARQVLHIRRVRIRFCRGDRGIVVGPGTAVAELIVAVMAARTQTSLTFRKNLQRLHILRCLMP